MYINCWILLFVLAIAVITDIKSGKIKNWLTFPATVIGLLISWIMGGRDGLIIALTGAGIMMAIGLFMFFVNLIGAGDAKLLIVVGAMSAYPLGFLYLRDALIYIGLAGGIQAITVLLLQKRLIRVGEQVVYAAILRVLAHNNLMTGMGSSRIPYSIAMAVGTTIAMIWPL